MSPDQDERLNLLSHSIGRQNDLSLQIGSELDMHHQLLEETDTAMDRTAASLGRAKRRLDKVADEAKQHGKLDFGSPHKFDNSNNIIYREYNYYCPSYFHFAHSNHRVQDMMCQSIFIIVRLRMYML